MDHSVILYSFDPAWLKPNYTEFFLLLSAIVVELTVAVVVLADYRRFARHRHRRVSSAVMVAILAVVAVEASLSGLAAWLPMNKVYSTQGEFWKFRPNLPHQAVTQEYSPDSLLTLKRLAPNIKSVVVGAARAHTVVFSNSLGLREREIPLEKEPGEYRIACVGDSWTFGFGVLAEEAFPRVLETLLQKAYPTRKITVINAGINGAHYCQGYLMLTQVVLRYHPDLVLSCGYGGCDEMPLLEAHAAERARPIAVLNRSTLYTVARQAVLWVAGKPTQGFLTRADYARKMARLLSSLGIAGIFLEAWDCSDPSQTLVTVAREHLEGIGAIPGQAAIQLHPPLARHWTRAFTLQQDQGHPNPAGHAAIAAILADYIKARGYVGGQPARPGVPAGGMR